MTVREMMALCSNDECECYVKIFERNGEFRDTIAVIDKTYIDCVKDEIIGKEIDSFVVFPASTNSTQIAITLKE